MKTQCPRINILAKENDILENGDTHPHNAKIHNQKMGEKTEAANVCIIKKGVITDILEICRKVLAFFFFFFKSVSF